MEQDDPVGRLYARAKQANVPMASICREAKIAATTPSRWKRGLNGPTLQTVRELNEALDRLLATPDAQAAA